MSQRCGDLAPVLDAVRASMRAIAAVGDPAGFGVGSRVEKGAAGPLTIADLASQVAAILSLERDVGTGLRILAEENMQEIERHGGDALLVPVVAAVRAAGFHCDESTVRRCLSCECDQGGHGAFWSIDPLDGTKGYLRGGQFAVAVALIEGGTPALAALGLPRLGLHGAGPGPGVLLGAVRGQGAHQSLAGAWAPQPVHCTDWHPGTPIRLAGSVETSHSSGDALEAAAGVLGQVHPVRVDSQAKYGLVARGDADAYLRRSPTPGYAECSWDHAAGALIAHEAGCRITDVHGKPLDFRHGHRLAGNEGVVCAPPRLHAALLGALSPSIR